MTEPTTTNTGTIGPPGTMLVADVARLLTEEARNTKPDAGELKVSTVLSWIKESRKEDGRYYANPVPVQAGYLGSARQVIWWRDDQKQEWLAWFRSRPGHGHGTGGRRAGGKAKVAVPAKRRAGTGSNAALAGGGPRRVTHRCGHEATYELTGSASSRSVEAARLRKSDCPACAGTAS